MSAPITAWAGSADPEAPLVVLPHGRGSDEQDIIRLADERFEDVPGPIDRVAKER